VKKINLRTIKDEDLEFFRNEFYNPRVWENLSSYKPSNLRQQEKYFEEFVFRRRTDRSSYIKRRRDYGKNLGLNRKTRLENRYLGKGN